MNEHDDRQLHQLLADAGERWRAQQPPPPEPDVDRWHTGRGGLGVPPGWAVLAAAAAVVAVILGGVSLGVVTRGGGPASSPGQAATSTTPPSTNATVRATVDTPPAPFVDAPVPTTPVPLIATGDPAKGYVSSPTCRGGVKVVARGRSRGEQLAITVTVARVDGARCVLTDRPRVEVLNGGREPMPVSQAPTAGGDYGFEVTVGQGGVAESRIVLTEVCDPIGREVLVRVSVPGIDGTEYVGTGAPPCAEGVRPTVQIGAFAPLTSPEGAPRTRFSGVRAELAAPQVVRAGETLHATVTLTARDDVSLVDACPGFMIGVYDPDDGVEQEHALNCAGVPGQVLPRGVPVRFEIETPVPAGFVGEGKVVWLLLTDDRIAVLSPARFAG